MPIGGKPKKPKIPAARPTPPPIGVEGQIARQDVKARRKKVKGRRLSRLTIPGTLTLSDVNILRPELKDEFA